MLKIEKKHFVGCSLNLGGKGPLPHLFCMNLLVRVKLGYTQNFTALGHLEVP